jgi:RNA polymerase sigma-70 factor (ECF subfamily)
MDRNGFNHLLAHLRPKLYRFALAYTKRADEAEDVVQEVGVRLWERRGELHALRSVEAYAMSAVRHRCLDYIRSPRSQANELMEACDAVHEQTPHRKLELADMAAYARRLAAQLPELQQAVLRLRDIEGYELEEVAEMLGMNEGAVRSNLSRARQKLREALLKQ